MFLSFREKGPTITIDCPKCKATDVVCETYEQRDTNYGITRGITLHRTHWVDCPVCRTSLLSKRPVAELPNCSPLELREVIVWRGSRLGVYVWWGALVMAIVPILGTAAILLALALNRRHRAWRNASLVLLLLHVTGFALVILTRSKPG